MTFTIVGRDPSSGAIGAAVSTASAACGKRVLHYRPQCGLVITQGKTNVLYGVHGLAMLQAGLAPASTLEALLHLDQNRRFRQVLVTDLAGDWHAFTGGCTETWHGHAVASECVVIGNTLAGPQVLEAMADAFGSSRGSLAARLVESLRHGENAGGDRQGRRSAAVLVTQPNEFQPYGASVDLRIDLDAEPVRKLAEMLLAYSEWEAAQLASIDRRIYYFETEAAPT
jgi:uncharacterized Ntn-hydrolase superfamily protein